MAFFNDRSEPDIPACGGSTTTFDDKAPKVIVSREIVWLSCDCSFRTVAEPVPPYEYIAAFAAKVDNGVLAGYIARDFHRSAETLHGLGVVSDAVLADLAAIVEKYDFARSNGRCHSTSGLPENFGGSLSVDYASGESIYFSDNQSPIIRGDAGAALVDCMKRALKKDAVKGLPTAADVTGLRFEERDKEGGYHIIDWNGTALHTEQKYRFDGDDGPVYVKDATTAPEDFDRIRALIDRNGLLYWGGLPERSGPIFEMYDKSLTFRLKDGTTRTVRDVMKGPDFTRNGIFETEMAVNEVLRDLK